MTARNLTVPEAANLLGVSRRQVVRLVATNDVTGAKTGEGKTAAYEIDPDSVRTYLDRNTRTAARPAPALADVDDLPFLYTFQQVGDRLQRSVEALRADARAGKFEYIKLGNDFRMTAAQVRALIEQSTIPAAGDEDDELAAVRDRVTRQIQRQAARGAA